MVTKFCAKTEQAVQNAAKFSCDEIEILIGVQLLLAVRTDGGAARQLLLAGLGLPIVGEATVKTFSRKNGHIWLLPANADFAPIDGDACEILGKVTAVLRTVR
ncbi:unannotated protein [freshwater metagenome]|uniref:Unannotated protein n=1 Tax=freshwater metagenome TaxID=449393 RepID=A0A6J6E7Y7_9ZZZZ